jgi:molybdate transport repressor ModE-like protein
MSTPRRYFKELRFRQLRALVLLARKGSFSAVAKALGISVPSAWQQIRSLEDEFSVPLVQATGQSGVLTEQGEQLVQIAQPLVEGFEQVRELFSERLRTLPRRIAVATTSSLLLHELQRPLALIRQQQPDLEMTFLDRPSTIARKHLENGDADVAILGRLGEEPFPRLEWTPLTAYPFVLVCPEGHPLLQARSLKCGDLIRHPLLMPGEGSNSRRQVEEVLSAAGLWPKTRVALTASSFDIVAAYVRHGFGIAVTSVSPMILRAITEHHPNYQGIAFRDLSALFGREEVVIARRRNHHELPHHRKFRETVVEVLGHKRAPGEAQK